MAINLTGADLVEVSPPIEHAEVTALTGAPLLMDMVCLLKTNAET